MSSALSNTMRRYLTPAAAAVIGLAAASDSLADENGHHHMILHSATFADGGTLPLSMINNSGPPGQNSCTASGAAGGNASPQLSWEHAPQETKSFVVIAYDVSAEFTHWQMYNIPASTTSLPDNAGTPGSIDGLQNGNDFFLPQAQYSGPCPPSGVMPFAHEYVFTVYALDVVLPVVAVSSPSFSPAGPEGLYQELIDAGLHGHILEKASIAGFFSSTPSN